MGKDANVKVYLNNEEAIARLKEIGNELKKLKSLKEKFLEEAICGPLVCPKCMPGSSATSTAEEKLIPLFVEVKQ